MSRLVMTDVIIELLEESTMTFHELRAALLDKCDREILIGSLRDRLRFLLNKNMITLCITEKGKAYKFNNSSAWGVSPSLKAIDERLAAVRSTSGN